MTMVSVIVPIYNVEQFLSRCIDCILAQAYREFELILINDGSSDNCGKICDEYAKMDTRIKVLHKKNGGVSSARNCGLQVAKGEYILFIDSDDYIDTGYIEQLMEWKEFDFVTAGYHRQHRSILWYEVKFDEGEVDIDTFRASPSVYLPKYDVWSPWAKLYKKSIIDKNGLLFDITVHRGEDVIFNFKYLEHVSTIRMLSLGGYYYNYRSNSLVHTLPDDNWIWAIMI